MMEKNNKRYISCPVCGKVLMKCQGTCDIEITCSKCNREIEAIIDEERIMIFENRRAADCEGRSVQVRVSIPKPKKHEKMQSMKKAANF